MPPYVLERVRSICAEIFAVPLNRIGAESSPETVETWDSVQHLNLVLALEQEFGTTFGPEEMDRMKNVGSIAALLEKRGDGFDQ